MDYFRVEWRNGLGIFYFGRFEDFIFGMDFGFSIFKIGGIDEFLFV